MNLRGNTVLITGGSSGIGAGIARAFLENDNQVIITGRNAEKLQKARAQLPGLTAIQSDVSNPDDIDSLYQRVAEEFGGLNILINNAGIMRKINLQNHDLSAAELTKEIDVNIKGPIWMNHAFLPLLKQQRGAAIVNVSAGLAFVPLPISPISSAAKAALHSYTLSLREQLRNTRVRVFELAPPATNTGILSGFSEADWKGTSMLSIDTMVADFMKGFGKDQYEIRPGQANQLKFMSRFFPGFILGQLSKNVDMMHAEQEGA